MYFRAADQDIDADNDYVKYPFDDWYILFAEFSITGFWHGGYNKTDYQKLGWYLGFREPSYTLTSDEEYLTYRLGVSRHV
jgi:hypothetical protein